ncbi:hypothetical protein [Haloarcula sp. CBA1127]|uniref:hypothetical protein n=1 Tax=Haloarcula sp. CBA1127 TaxID=1765055 RepID=UPI00073E88DA|nr:hypothetical protein [Haloarcula sp. CBA1127]
MTDDQIPERDTGRQSDLALMDSEEYKNKRRLERLLDAHDRVEEWDNESMSEYALGGIKMEAREVLLFRAVKQFIREAYNSLRNHHESVQEQDEPVKPDGYWVTDEPLGVIEFEHRADVHFYGLRDFVTANRMYSETWEEEVQRRNMPATMEEQSITKTVPVDITMEAYLLLKQFLDEERGLDLSFSETEGDAGYDYGELLNNAANPELAADGGERDE